MVKDFEGEPFLGPHSIALTDDMNLLYFTDCGPWGETSIENPKGSVFLIDLEASLIRPLALNCLAHPTGIALANEEKVLYVCETAKNRILRFIVTDAHLYNYSVFYQFSGRYGPTSMAIHSSGNLYIAHYEFNQITTDGEIAVLTPKGELLGKVSIPDHPEIVGMHFSKLKDDILYVTENSTSPTCLRVLINNDNLEKTAKDNKLNNYNNS